MSITISDLEKIVNLPYDVVDNYSGMTEVTIDNIVAAGQHGQEVPTTESLNLSFDAEDSNSNGINSNHPDKTNQAYS